jgi:uncharacterized membrane protein YesL
MGGSFRVFRWSLDTWWGEMALFSFTGLVSAVIALPFAVLAVLAFALVNASPILAIVFVMPFMPNPGWLGLSGMAHQLAQNEGANWQVYWDTLRRHWRRSTAMFFISLFGSVIILFGASFYMASDNPIVYGLGILMLYVLATWMMMHLYLLPLLLEQERGSVFRLYRNALLVVGAKPVLSLGMLIICLVVLVLGWLTLIGVPMVVLPFFAVYANCALRFAVYGFPWENENRNE